MGEDVNPGTESNGDGGQGINPAWNDLMNVVPEDLHSQIVPHLKSWDSGVQQKIDGLHGQYAPFKDFLDNDVDPEHLRMGLGLLNAIQTNPREVWETLSQQFNLSADDNSENNGAGAAPTDEDLSGVPQAFLDKMSRLEQGYELLAKQHLEAQEKATQQKQDEALQNQIAELKKQHGDFDEGYVLTALHLGAKPEEAIQKYQDLVDKIITEKSRPNPPVPLGAGGVGLPGEKRPDVTKMNSAQTKSYVAQLLANHAAQQNQ